jgi:hypothetical protein
MDPTSFPLRRLDLLFIICYFREARGIKGRFRKRPDEHKLEDFTAIGE